MYNFIELMYYTLLKKRFVWNFYEKMRVCKTRSMKSKGNWIFIYGFCVSVLKIIIFEIK